MINYAKNIFSLKINKSKSINRDSIIDYYRGIGMLLVLLHHCFVPKGSIILLFHMPMLFMLSGYTKSLYSSGRKMKYKDYIFKRLKKLIIPYFVFEFINLLIWFIYSIIINQHFSLLSALESIFLCLDNIGYVGLYNRLWFLPCMMMSDIFLYFILIIFKTKKTRFIAMLLMVILSWISSNVLPFRLPYTIDISFMATFFILIGYQFFDAFQNIINNKKIKIDIVIFILNFIISVICYKSGEAKMSMYINQYGNYFVSILCSISLTIVVILIFKHLYKLIIKIRNIYNLILWYSENSLYSFPVHLQIKCILLLLNYRLFSKFAILFPIVLISNIIIVNFITITKDKVLKIYKKGVKV